MQIQQLNEDGSLHKVRITLPAAKLSDALETETLKLSRTVKIDGFRPGKVPPDIIRQKYGTRLLNLAGEELMQSAFLKLTGERKIKLSEVHSMQSVQLESGKDFIFETEYEVFAETQLNITDAIELQLVKSKITEEDLNTMIESLRQRAATYEDILIVGTPAGKGHVAVLDCKLQVMGHPQSDARPSEIKVEMDKDHPSAAFVAGISGMITGDSKEIRDNIRIPADPQDIEGKELKEVPAIFNVTLKKLQKRVLPELNEEFYKSVGVETGKEADFRQLLRGSMEMEMAQTLTRIQKHKVYDSLIEAHKDFKVPPLRLKREAERMRKRSMDYWMETTGAKTPPSENEFPMKLFEERAERQLKGGMLLAEFAHRHSIEPKAEEVKKYIEVLVQSHEDPVKAKKEYTDNPELYRQVGAILLENMAIIKYKETVKVVEKELSYPELMRLNAGLS